MNTHMPHPASALGGDRSQESLEGLCADGGGAHGDFVTHLVADVGPRMMSLGARCWGAGRGGMACSHQWARRWESAALIGRPVERR
jgi:hypothetical protein